MSLEIATMKQASSDAEARILKAVDAISGAAALAGELAATKEALDKATGNAAANQATIDDLTAKLNAAIAAQAEIADENAKLVAAANKLPG